MSNATAQELPSFAQHHKRAEKEKTVPAPPPAAPQEQPKAVQQLCARSGTHMKLGGVDVDELRCRIALDLQRIVELEDKLLAILAQHAIQDSDIAAERDNQQKRDAWFKSYFGESQQ